MRRYYFAFLLVEKVLDGVLNRRVINLMAWQQQTISQAHTKLMKRVIVFTVCKFSTVPKLQLSI